MSIVLYGIPNCDAVKKARVWLTERRIDHAFHDYKKQGVERERIATWIGQAGLSRILNKAGTTYKRLPEALKVEMDDQTIIDVMVAQPSMIKRPIVEFDGKLLVGFKPEEWSATFS